MSRHPGVYNLTRQAGSILRRYRKEPPSLVMHLYSAGVRLGNNPESSLHSYEGDMKYWLDCVREQRMPNELLDVIDELGISFYDGCLIVEVFDHRVSSSAQPLNQAQASNPTDPSSNSLNTQSISQPNPSTNSHEAVSSDLPNPQVTSHRVVLSPTCATLWHDIMFLNEAKLASIVAAGHSARASEFKWGPITEEEAVELEAAILDRTTPALCLSPSIITCRIANQMLNETTPQPDKDSKRPRKRPLNSGEKEAMRRQRERQERFMHVADEGYDQAFAPTFSRFDLIKRIRIEHPQVPATSRVTIPKPTAQNFNPDQVQSSTAPLTIAPTDLYLPGNLPFDLKTEPNQTPSTAAVSNQLSLPTSTLPPTSPPAPPSSTSAPVPPKKTANSKKKATASAVLDERSETGSPAPLSNGHPKKLSKKAQKNLEMTPEALALAEEKKRKQAENRRLAKERKAAAAKAQTAAALKAASTTNPAATSQETNSVASPNPPDHSIPVPNRSPAAPPQTTHQHTSGAESGIPVVDSIPILTNNIIPASTHQLSSTGNHSIPVPSLSIPTNNQSNGLSGIPVHPELHTNNNNSIPVPNFSTQQSIPVYSNGNDININNNNFSGHHDISIPGSEILPVSSQENILVRPVAMNEVNSIPVPSRHQHPNAELSSIPVPQSDPQVHRWNNFGEFGIVGHRQDQQQQQQQQQRPGEMDIHVGHHHSSQVTLGSSLGSIEIPAHIHPPPPHLLRLNQQQFQFQPGSLPDNHSSNNGWNN